MAWNNEAQSFQVEGEITYADTGNIVQRPIFWQVDTSNEAYLYLSTASSRTGQLGAIYEVGGSALAPVGVSTTQYSPGVNVAFSAGMRWSASEAQVAGQGSGGTTLANTVGAVDLSASDLAIGATIAGASGSEGVPMYITAFRYWDVDLYDAGIEEQTS